MCIYIYIYVERERVYIERERGSAVAKHVLLAVLLAFPDGEFDCHELVGLV